MGPYFLHNKGKRRCPEGARNLKSTAECKKACAMLQIHSSGNNLTDGKRCYKGGRDSCKQGGYNGGGASMICQNKSNFMTN